MRDGHAGHETSDPADARLSPFAFGGSPSDVRRLMRFYASMFAASPVAELGVGRGYFLEAIRERSIEATGTDISEESVAAARELGFAIANLDATEFLRDQRGLAGIFASHVVEHLEPDAVRALLDAAWGALDPGGLIVLVTPDIRDLRVLTEWFWLDPTHVRPYPPALLASLLTGAGFSVDRSGHGPVPRRPREWPGLILGKIRYGAGYGRQEAWIAARKRVGSVGSPLERP